MLPTLLALNAFSPPLLVLLYHHILTLQVELKVQLNERLQLLHEDVALPLLFSHVLPLYE
jgi:hypothetical protein